MTLAQGNYERLRSAGIEPERAYIRADEWALHSVAVLGHELRDGKLWIQLCAARPGAVPYEAAMPLKK